MNKVTIVTSSSPKDKNGMGRYTTELINNLLSLKSNTKVIDVIQPKNRIRFPLSILYELIIIPLKLISSNPDVVHATSPESAIAPIILGKRTVVTVYDMIYFTYPAGTKFLKRIYFRIAAKLLNRSTFIITISEFSRQEIVQLLKIPSKKVKVIHLGIDRRFKRLEGIKKQELIGYLGGNIGRKNVAALIKSFALLKNDPRFSEYKLVLAIDKNENLIQLIEYLNVPDVEFLGKISEDEIVKFYNSLTLFVYPSLYEGFGFPPLEAMACGCPVVCGDNTSIPEVVGDAALRVDTSDIKALSETVSKVLLDQGLRKKLIEKGIDKSSKYRWETTVDKTVEVYKDLTTK